MIDYSELLYRIKNLPLIPRIFLFCLAGVLVISIMWSAIGSFVPAPPQHSSTSKKVATPADNPVSPLIFGTNMGLFNSDDQVLTSAPTRSLLQQIHTQIIRMPVRTNLSEATEIQAAQDIKNLGAVPAVDLLGPTDPNALIDDTRVVSDMNGIFGNSLVYYEYGNEEDLVGVSAERYTASWNAVVPLLKQLAPQAHFAGPVTYQYDQTYLTTFLKGAQPLPDEVSWHEYTCVAAETQDTCITRIDDWTTHIASARTAMTAAIGKALPIMITEWNYAPDATPTDGKSNDSIFLSTWTLKALQTLVANHVFASMQYFCTGAVPLVDSHNNLAVQGIAFQAVYEHVMARPQYTTPAATDQSISTATTDSTQSLQPTATTATTDSTQTLQPTATTDSTQSLQSIATDPSTSTSASTPTPAPTPTPTPTPQDLYTTITSRWPTYTTSLANQDGGQWQTGSFSGGGGCEFANGAYAISVPLKNTMGVCDANGISIVDFALQVQMKITGGDGGGVDFRDSGSSFYHFSISSNGTFNLANQTNVIASGSNSAIKKGQNQTNVLAVIARGQQIAIYVNGQLLAHVTDSASDSGKIGLFAVDVTNPTQAAFSNLKVWSSVSSTATTTLTPISVLMPTPTPTPQDLYTTITSKRPAYTTSLANQDGGQWQTGLFKGGGGCGFTNGAYDVSIPQKDTVAICDANATSVVNFAFQVRMSIVSGDGGGIVFRDRGRSFYRFRVSSNGTFNLVNQTHAIANGSSAAIKTGLNQSNVLTVIARGQQIAIYVNGRFLTNVTDSASSSGKIGLFAVDFTNPTRAVFSNLKVWLL